MQKLSFYCILNEKSVLQKVFMQYIIYFFLALVSTTIGSLTGMGGGVIIKPLMDVLGD